MQHLWLLTTLIKSHILFWSLTFKENTPPPKKRNKASPTKTQGTSTLARSRPYFFTGKGFAVSFWFSLKLWVIRGKNDPTKKGSNKVSMRSKKPVDTASPWGISLMYLNWSWNPVPCEQSLLLHLLSSLLSVWCTTVVMSSNPVLFAHDTL